MADSIDNFNDRKLLQDVYSLYTNLIADPNYRPPNQENYIYGIACALAQIDGLDGSIRPINEFSEALRSMGIIISNEDNSEWVYSTAS